MVIKFCMIFTQRGFNTTLCKTKLTNFRLTTRAIFIMGKKFCRRFRNADRYLIIHVGKAKDKPSGNLSWHTVSTSGVRHFNAALHNPENARLMLGTVGGGTCGRFPDVDCCKNYFLLCFFFAKTN